MYSFDEGGAPKPSTPQAETPTPADLPLQAAFYIVTNTACRQPRWAGARDGPCTRRLRWLACSLKWWPPAHGQRPCRESGACPGPGPSWRRCPAALPAPLTPAPPLGAAAGWSLQPPWPCWTPPPPPPRIPRGTAGRHGGHRHRLSRVCASTAQLRSTAGCITAAQPGAASLERRVMGSSTGPAASLPSISNPQKPATKCSRFLLPCSGNQRGWPPYCTSYCPRCEGM